MSNALGAVAEGAAPPGGSFEPGPQSMGIERPSLAGREFFIDPNTGKVQEKREGNAGASVTPPAAEGNQGEPPRPKIGEKGMSEDELNALIANSVPKDSLTRLRQKDNQQLDEERQKIREELEKEYAPIREAKKTFDSLPAHVRDNLIKKNLAGVMSEGQVENRFVELLKDIDPQSAEGKAVDTLGRALTAQIQENERLQQTMGDYDERLFQHNSVLSYTVLNLQAKELAAELRAEGIEFPREQQQFLIKGLMNSQTPITEEAIAKVWAMVNPGKAAQREQKRGATNARQQLENAAAGSTTPGGSPAPRPAGGAGVFTKEDAVRHLESRFPDRAGSGRISIPFAVG